MKFIIKDVKNNQNFSLIYRDEDYSFDIEPFYESGDSSIMINELQLEIDYEGKIIYVWGYCPLIKYKDTEEYPKIYQTNTLVASLYQPLIPGISYRINENERWPIYINKKQGWICIGNPQINGKKMVEFAPNCIACLENQEFRAIWLKPLKLPLLE